jgi:hypothetical protein
MTPPENAIEAQMAGEIKMPAKAAPRSPKTHKIAWTYD